MASTEVGTENNRTQIPAGGDVEQIPAGGDVDRTTQDLIHLDLNNLNGGVFFVLLGIFTTLSCVQSESEPEIFL